VVIQIETARGLAAREEICAVPGTDVIFIGTSDLSQSLGVDMAGPELKNAVDQIVISAQQAQKVVGIIGPSRQALQPFADNGVNFLTVGADGAILMHGARQLLAPPQ
jgi:2-keto-3-deoxy-L-rhamnonate aldolase RhmA